MRRGRRRDPIVAGLFLPLALCQAPAVTGGPRDDLAAAQALWAQKGTATYAYDFRRICACPLEVTEPVHIQVSAGAIVSIRSKKTGEDLAPARFAHFLTIAQVFDRIAEGVQRHAEIIEVSYDERLGYPIRMFVDPARAESDDEETILISELVPAKG